MLLGNADLAQWREHGYVVLRAAISRAEADAAADVLWQHIEASPDDPESWYNPAAKGLWIPLYHEPLFLVSGAKLKPMKAHGNYGCAMYKGLGIALK